MELKSIYSLGELVRKLKIGPLLMDTVNNHTVKNLGALVVLTALLTLSVGVFAGGLQIGLFGAGLLSAITAMVIGVIGVVVNLVLPAHPNSSQDSASEDTNKVVSYAVVAFIFTVAVFVTIGGIFLLFGQRITSFMDLLTVEYLWPVRSANLFTSFLCATIGTFLLQGGLWIAGRIEAQGLELAYDLASTILICGIVFYVSHFLLFQ